ncbi:hypothetical protein K461DRAFT_58495 [Myriangium duriaei CBS 260.36]|uniref:Uncharacterized protein n=1 Tax=Myriangium duriaei CBS 260.36 TaxID=1168546 RepID=A0A9P4IWM1_9PEZI|nr:hypothetical protein K461DRAFT_58495 [Myriangium duriaei CBS 260.36]
MKHHQRVYLSSSSYEAVSSICYCSFAARRQRHCHGYLISWLLMLITRSNESSNSWVIGWRMIQIQYWLCKYADDLFEARGSVA